MALHSGAIRWTSTWSPRWGLRALIYRTWTAQPVHVSNACILHPADQSGVPQGLAGWPKLHFQVWSRQKGGRAQIREILPLRRGQE